MPMGGSSDGGAAALEKARQARINTGETEIDKAFSGFDDSFYKQRAQDYVSYATPQVVKQYQNTRNNLAYALARNGLSKSGAAVKNNQALTDTENQNLSNIANEGQNEANTLRGNVASQKTNVVNQLISSADPTAARESAATATAGLSAPGAFQPIGNLFSDFSNTYLQNLAARSYAPNTPSLWSQLASGFGGGGGGGSGGSAVMVGG